MTRKRSKATGARSTTAARKKARTVAAKATKSRSASLVVHKTPGARAVAGVKAAPARAPAEAKKYILGSSSIFTPEVMNDIHIKSELGRYRMRGFSLFKKIPHWDDLTFLPGTLTRFVIEGYREKCETKTVIGPLAKRPIGAGHPGLRHRHVVRRAVLRGQDCAGARRDDGRIGDLFRRRRHDPRRATLFGAAGFTSASSRATALIRITCASRTAANSSSARAARSASAAT